VPIAQATEAEAAEREAAAQQREAAAVAARAQAEAVRAPTVMQLHCTSAQLALGVVHSCLSRVCVPCNQCIR
jgi:hypothetical protein